ncbi:ABC transporter permease [Stigmatella erecta]|uniref:Nucleoside ABC transporter membrane protein n=1 Tax=Stigmatella erecta TaxID=83460 RepID=A0A1I0LFU2_9BACT|nr:ABC transporter permease [Stigmatella erecta]SEU39039.1 nucleoside ABC transporter membrane protein [Stigmatella erecta]
MIRFEEDPHPRRLKLLGVYGAVLALAFALAGAVFAAYGVGPGEAYGTLLEGTLGDTQGLAEVLRRTLPLLLIGSGLTLAFRVRFFNIGAEGQLLLGAVASGAVALFLPPGVWSLPLMFLAGAVAGGLWALPAAWLRSHLNVNEILTTLMLNPVAASLVIYLVSGPWRGEHVQGYTYTDEFAEAARLPLLEGTLVHWPTLVLGVGLALALQVLLTRTPLGYALRVVGESPRAARYAGMPLSRVVLLTGLLSGGAAGLAGAGEVAGIHHRLLEPGQLSTGYGFTAIIVAWLARGHPALVLLTAPLMGLILAGGDLLKISLNMPFRVIDVFSGLMLLCLIAGEALSRYRVRWAA